jgi:2-polyprenyl-6-methoxyphenol hydroxylase-like FAD-dependent oxidoreductase
LGDQAAVIPSFAGEGVSMALESAHLAADCMLLGQSADQFQRAFADLVRQKIKVATTLSQILTTHWGQVLATNSLRLAPQLLGRVATFTRMDS